MQHSIFLILFTGKLFSELLCLIYKANARRNADGFYYSYSGCFSDRLRYLAKFSKTPMIRKNTVLRTHIVFRDFPSSDSVYSLLGFFFHSFILYNRREQ